MFAPIEVVKNWAFYSLGAEEDIARIIRTDMLLEAVFGSLVVPALIHALVKRRQSGEQPGVGESFRWGYRQWGRTFGNRWLAGMATLGGTFLFVIPGIVFWIWFSLIEPVVAIEADNQPKALTRSRSLTEGSRWAILFSFVLMGLLFAVFAVLSGVPFVFVDNWMISAFIDCGLDVGHRAFVVMTLVIYLSVSRDKPLRSDAGANPLGISERTAAANDS